MTVTALKPTRFPWYRYDRYAFSLGLQLGGRTFLSGHTASAYDTAAGRMSVTGGLGEQVRTAYAKIGAILEAAGQTLADVVRVVEYVTEAGIERYADSSSVAPSNGASGGSDASESRPSRSRNSGDVPNSDGRPGVSSRPTSETRPRSTRARRTPSESTPRIAETW